MNAQETIGHLIDRTAKRDAIHIAMCPVMAGERLLPGEHIGFIDKDNRTMVTASSAISHVGIVDPFLQDPVRYGQWFWMFMYPNTVTGMRHEWEHPLFPSAPKTDNPLLDISYSAMTKDGEAALPPKATVPFTQPAKTEAPSPLSVFSAPPAEPNLMAVSNRRDKDYKRILKDTVGDISGELLVEADYKGAELVAAANWPTGSDPTTTEATKLEGIRRAKAWLNDFAQDLNITYEALMAAADRFQQRGSYTCDNDAYFSDVSEEKWEMFELNYYVVTGNRITVDKDKGPFTCSC